MEIDQLLSQFRNKKVLITGHTGFKGSWLSIWLNFLGADVIGIALDPKTDRDNYNISGVSKLVKDYRFDIRDRKRLFEVFEIEKPEILFHLAAQPLVLESYQTPLDTFEINAQGTANIMEAVRISKTIHTVVIITTDKVYENKEWIWPYRETESLGGYDPYSASKGAAELIVACYRNSFFNPSDFKTHGKSVASARAGNVIGGGDWAANRIVPDCIRAIEQDKQLEVRSPKSIRPWQHVLEPLGGYLLLAANMIKSPAAYSEAWNFGPDPENIVTVGKLVDTIVHTYGKGSWKDASSNKTLHEANLLALDINKAKSKLKWYPVLDFENTIQYTVDWYKHYHKQNPLDICLNQIKTYMNLWKSKNVI
jgi:CDP-glucose 4,6-dehydratase